MLLYNSQDFTSVLRSVIPTGSKGPGSINDMAALFRVVVFGALREVALVHSSREGNAVMANRRKMWVYSPPRTQKPKLPGAIKAALEEKATDFVERVLKPKFIKPPPEKEFLNYVVDIYTKWYRNYFYFCAKYCSPAPNALSPYFEIKFARMEYVGLGARFNLSFMRHTGQWVEIYQGIPLDECLSAIEYDPWFQL